MSAAILIPRFSWFKTSTCPLRSLATSMLQSPEAVNKSREASQIASQVLDGVISQVAAGKRAVELCSFGDSLIEKLVAPLYKTNKKMEKGIAFPTCVSVNNCVAHYSPLESEDKIVLKDGDVVKMCVPSAA